MPKKKTRQGKSSYLKQENDIFALVLIISTVLIAIASINFCINYRDVNNFRIESKHYGFELQTPKDWFGFEKTVYSENKIDSLLAECKNDKSDKPPLREIGKFRFESQKYPNNFTDGTSSAIFPSGVILEATINCVPEIAKKKVKNFDLQFLGSAVFGGIKSISFLHNNFQFKFNEMIYVSPKDKTNRENLQKKYADLSDKIIASIKFVK